MTYELNPPLPRTDTPKDYHRIHFDPANVSSKRIVGLLACQRDPLLKELPTKVVSVTLAQIAEPPAAKGRAKQKKPSSGAQTPNGTSTPPANGSGGANEAEKEIKGRLWEVQLEDTIIFPEGGGQPFDTGSIVFGYGKDEARTFSVEGCLRRKLDSVHLVRVDKQDEEFVQSLEGREVTVKVDWKRRVDHMSIHTAQHLLSAILDTYAEGLNTLSWGFAAYPSLDPPYVELPRSLTWAEAEEVEQKCNEAIERGVKIWVDVDSQQEGYVKTTAAGVREHRGIPDDYENGVIRHIIIDSIDKNACCGTQLPSLAPIGFLHIVPPSTPSTSSKPNKTPSRLFFYAGPRAIRAAAQTSRQVSLAAQAISVGRADLVERVEKMDVLRKETASREKDLRIELARVLGGSTTVPGDGVVYLRRTEKATHDFEFMGALGQAVGGAKLVVLVSAVQEIQPSLVMVLSGDADLAKSTNEAIKGALSKVLDPTTPENKGGRYKGGGAKGRYMGKVDGKWGKAEDEAMEEVLSGLRRQL